MIFKISFLLQHLIKSRIEKDWTGGLILSAGGVEEFFFFSFQRVTPGHGCCLGEVIHSPVGAVSWSLQHPQTGFPSEGDAVTLSCRLESGFSILIHIGIKTPALGKPLQLLFGISTPFPLMEGGQCTVSHSLHRQISGLEPTWPTRSGHSELIMESSQEWEAADPALHYAWQSCGAHLIHWRGVKVLWGVFCTANCK